MLNKASIVNAQGLGISPANLELRLLRGNEAHASFTIFNPSNSVIEYLVDNKEFPSWFEFIPDRGSIKPKSREEVKVVVRPDELAANGVYDSLVLVGLNNENSDKGVSLNLGTAIKTKVIITGKQIINLAVKDISVEDGEQGSAVLFRFDLQNNGNVKVLPNALIKIKRNNVVIESFEKELEEVMPGNSNSHILEWNVENRDVGEYSALTSINLKEEVIVQKMLDFKILPYGELGSNGAG